jgi:PhnB protein
MAKVSTYLNFQGTTEEAFNFYAEIFQTKTLLQVVRFKDMPDGPEVSVDDRSKILHIELPILGGHILMGTDMLESLGQKVEIGNNTTINLELDSVEEADAFYAKLSAKGSSSTGMSHVAWGYWGCTLDRYGIRWMFNVMSQN